MQKLRHGQRLNSRGYSTILRLIANRRNAAHGATWHDLMRDGPLTTRSATTTLLRWMDHLGLIYIDQWVAIGTARTTMTPAYRLGDQASAPHPGYINGKPGPATTRPAGRVPIELLTYSHAVKALQRDSHHGKSLHEACGMGLFLCRALLRKLHADRLVYIDDYYRRPNGCLGAPMYAWGVHMKDAVRPPRECPRAVWQRANAERAARLRAMHALGMVRHSRIRKIADIGVIEPVAA